MGDQPCKELIEAVQRTTAVHPASHGCTDCLAMAHGGIWVHLRLCLTCGHVGCCDSSPNRHATKHFHDTKHPTIRSYEPGEEWVWCYVHESAIDGYPGLDGEAATKHYNPPHR
jgi:uncharacterized UBP type Zn finger protein